MLDIVIINYNSDKLTTALCDKIFSFQLPFLDKIIIIDNDSDLSRDFSFSFQNKNIVVKHLCSNIGFARACNYAFSSIVTSFYCLLLNPDIEITKKSLASCYQTLEANPALAAISPLILNSDHSIQHPPYYSFPSVFTEIKASLLGRRKAYFNNYSFNKTNPILDVKHICGCFMMLNTSFIKGKLFNHNLPFSYEDLDLCKRLSFSPGHVALLASTSVIHHGGLSSGTSPNKKVIWGIIHSRLMYYSMHSSRVEYCILILYYILFYFLKLGILCMQFCIQLAAFSFINSTFPPKKHISATFLQLQGLVMYLSGSSIDFFK
ncbi:glycosyltransferase [Synechococcus sp. RS9917]|nr:glycosyltransferase [Synechococcus sp. RS9917]